MTVEATKQKRFRPWVWVAILPGIMTLLAPLSGSPGLVISWLFVTGLVVFLAWRVRRTPWWAVLGWVLTVWAGTVLIVFASNDGPTPIAPILFMCIGAALGIAGLIVNSIKSSATPTPPA